MGNYGLPYQGSKNTIAEDIIRMLPRGDVLIDVFAGGCAITHAALLSGKWGRIVANDITDTAKLFAQLCRDGLTPECWRAVTRDEFFMLKDVNPVIRYCWSFGCDGRSYLWPKDIEEIKSQAVRMITAPTVNARRLEYMKFIDLLKNVKNFESLESLESLEVTQGDYRNLTILDGAVVYCDPPYEGTSGYLNEFDCDEFRDWCKEVGKSHPIFISEYSMPDDFVCVFSVKKRCKKSATVNLWRTEKLYTLEKWVSLVLNVEQLTLFNDEA